MRCSAGNIFRREKERELFLRSHFSFEKSFESKQDFFTAKLSRCIKKREYRPRIFNPSASPKDKGHMK
jgi:hypothetical protein